MKHISKQLALAVTLSVIGNTFIFNSADAAENETLDKYSGDEYVVTATRTELTEKEVPQSVEVIDREEIENIGAVTVRDVLKTANNMIIVDGGGGHGDHFSIRGSSTNNILILVNGRRVAGENMYANGSGNTRILDRLNLSNVERIEIVRGPGSALYGSDAQGGVINIITKKSVKPEFSVGAASSSRETSNYYHMDTGKDEKVSATFDVSFAKLRNFDGKAGAGFSYGPKQNYNLNIDYEMNKNNLLNLTVDYNKDKLQYQGMRRISKRDQTLKTVALTYEGNNKNSEYSLSSAYSKFENETANRKYKYWNVEARDSIKTAGNNKLTFGAEYRVNDGSAYVVNGDDRAKQYAVYVQDEYRLNDKLLLVPSVRYDHHNSFGSHTSPNLGVTYFINDNSRLKANYGSAYRAPSVDELYGMFNHGGMFEIQGNPDLKPEQTRGYELTYEHEFDDQTSAKLTYFNMKKKDAINLEAIPGTGRPVMGMILYDQRFVNIDNTTNKGIEFEVKHEFGNGFTAIGNYNWLDAKNDDTGEKLSYAARNTYTAKLMWTDPAAKSWNVTAWNRWYMGYNYNDREVNGNTFNVVVNKRWGDKYRAYVGIDNFFNKKISVLSYYGRLWRAGVEISL